MAKWGVLTVLGAAQFLMVLDQAVMNVAISQLVEDFDTTVTTIQAVIALYALVMAGLMLTGGKLGDIWGRRRAFTIGLCIYARLGPDRRLLERPEPDARLVGPRGDRRRAGAAGDGRPGRRATSAGQDRALAYGVLGGVAGAGIAVGPILGGWATTELSWRVVFAGEVVVAIGILLGMRLIREPARPGRRRASTGSAACSPRSASALMVFGVLQASNWGWLLPRNSPIEPFGFSLTPFVIAAGGADPRRLPSPGSGGASERGEDPLVHLGLLTIPPLRGGLSMLLAQNLILMGIFFTVPLFLQIVQGLDALETGVRMLPASVGLFVTALAGSALASRFPARTAGPRRARRRLRRRPCCCSTRSSPSSTTPPSWSRWACSGSAWA